ncbi:MAG: hypothetical protein BMS9Abin37_1845 [Acidobacteriota bacterium]|nr:MAG: hypothetical protein BMS9Abin37_1845 [Acidobacteriota bacterium]
MHSTLRQYALPAIVFMAVWLQQGNPDYERGREALDRGDWQGAVEAFEEVGSDDSLESREPLEDAALYWQAYAYNKLGDTDRALDLASSLQDRYPDSQWRDDARALVVEIRGSAGGDATDDEELKIMALNALIHSDDDDALPILEEFLAGDHPIRLKGRALFVLAQIGSERSYAVLAETARNDKEPELQESAIRYLGVHHNEQSLDLLVDLYASLDNLEPRRMILQSFMIAGEKDRLLELARDEPDDDLRGRAIRLLGTMDATSELGELYESEDSEDVRKKILQAFMVSGDDAHLLSVARNAAESEELRMSAIRLLGVQGANDELWTLYGEENSEEIRKGILHGLFIAGDVERIGAVARDTVVSDELRSAAIHNLGNSGNASRPLLMEIYESDTSEELKRLVLHSLFVQSAAGELVTIARAERDADLKKQAVHWLSLMDTPEAKEFMMEILRR